MRILSSIILISALMVISFDASAQRNYNTYAKRSRPSTPPWTISFNGGVFFPELFGTSHPTFENKEYNPAFGISIGRQLISNIGIRADVSTGKLSGNNYDTPPALTDQTPSFYRSFTSNVQYSGSLNLVLSFPLFGLGNNRNHIVSISGWGGIGMLSADPQFIQNPRTTIKYGTVIDAYTCLGGALKYRLTKRVDIGANYVANFYNGYNLDGVNVHEELGATKDRYSFAYISVGVLLGEIKDWRYGRTRSCYSF